MLEERLEIVGGTEIANDIRKKIETVGVRGLDIEKATELGVWTRISNLLCVMHASIMAANRVYGNVDYMVNMLQGRKNEIAREMNVFEKSYDRFISFWTNYYAHGDAGKEVVEETENLYHKIMQWADMPEAWQLGDEQRTNGFTDTSISVDTADGKRVYFYKTDAHSEVIGDTKESWCVTKFDMDKKVNITVNTDMDKASAMMVAKRLSEQDAKNVYTASMVTEVTEKKTVVTPYKAYMANNTVGNLKKVKV